jgi:Na+-transporting NADH:ubiquinone oxidoreductase subunit B
MERPEFMQQKIMRRVLFALAPVAAVSVYYFGWRIAAMLALSGLVCFVVEWYMTSRRGTRISEACFVTAAIYGLSLPPLTPFWIVAAGALIAILFGKEVFGGFGRNVFNPAIVGRAFVYVAFPVELTSQFVPVFRGFPGGFSEWSFPSSSRAAAILGNAGIAMADAVTAATPMWSLRDFGHVTPLFDLFLGSVGGIFEFRGFSKVLGAGSAGEVSALVIILSGIYLMATKTAQWRLTVSTLLGAVALNALLRYVAGLDLPGIPFTLFSGALLYVAVFMVTDPISAPRDVVAQWLYGLFIGMLVVFFRYKSIFAGGAAFSILFGNMLAPSLDLWIKRIRFRVKSQEAK